MALKCSMKAVLLVVVDNVKRALILLGAVPGCADPEASSKLKTSCGIEKQTSVESENLVYVDAVFRR